ncbi:MAG: 50S ribosomal protein L22 [Ignavibacteria bacterium]|jgi:large subunit ribosomal protein L22|nr:50S ribosomal protein L22 [Ignavibacteria bacterium]MBK6770660.1 50S ribosomal protein L22 [Ignavibacteria bacterium]MBK7159178.1 50S ribosomal protein L22 [Ignavibacteria bacterium]MBK7254052.1 50S ribosomal protein L22 [Ignavibacteria bacterium]MBK7446970.1 50S ribosomal protein L22 [Ignavibacteria bacterium]
MEARALKRHVGSSPRKMRLVVDLIRNKRVDEAISILRFTNKNAAKVVEQTLASAYSNLVNKLDSGRITQNEVIIKEAYVNEGPSMKRVLPAPQGRAFRIRKRSSHLTLVVEQLEIK